MTTVSECLLSLECSAVPDNNPSPENPSFMNSTHDSASSTSPILWIDGVGGFLLVDRDEVTLGQALADSSADICIVGDLSRRAAVLRRCGSDYLLQPLQACQLNARSVDRPLLLGHEDLIELGQHVKLKFAKPHPLSATARLDLLSLGRFKPHVDAVLLMADSCVLGAKSSCHVVCPHWSREVMLVRRSQGWVFNAQEELEVNGRMQRGQIAVESGLRICGADFSLSIE